jgi:ribonuclease Z
MNTKDQLHSSEGVQSKKRLEFEKFLADLSMIYTSDTRPETVSIQQARNGSKGVDVFIHELVLPSEVVAMKNLGLTFQDHSASGFDQALARAEAIVEADHTQPGAFGYLLSQIDPRPLLTVVAHFWTVDDTVECALNCVRKHFPEGSYPELGKNIVWSTDLMVLKVKNGY